MRIDYKIYFKGLGDPTFCGNCLAVLNSNSKVLNKVKTFIF